MPVARRVFAAAVQPFALPPRPVRRPRGLLPCVAAGVLSLSAALAPAAPVEVPDPAAWSQLSPAERARRRAELQQRLEGATLQERAQFRRQLRERLEGLSPQDRRALIGRTREQWQQLPPEQRERLVQERRERLQAMSPAERRQLLQQRRLMLEKLSPEEREALREKLPER